VTPIDDSEDVFERIISMPLRHLLLHSSLCRALRRRRDSFLGDDDIIYFINKATAISSIR